MTGETTPVAATMMDTANAGTDPLPTSTTVAKAEDEEEGKSLPKNRFELELEFVQSLASPAYLHFLATCRVPDQGGGTMTVLQDPAFLQYLRYLRDTWTQPAYAQYLVFPHALYFLQLLIDKPAAVAVEWTLPAFRNFCHQQQFLAWQHRHAVCYGHGITATTEPSTKDATDTTVATPEEPPLSSAGAP